MNVRWENIDETETYDGRGNYIRKGYLGNICVAVIYYNWYWMKVDPGPYSVDIFLPCAEGMYGCFSDIEELKKFAEDSVQTWLEKAGLL